MELHIKELAEEYKSNRDKYMRVRQKTKKKVRDFEKYLVEAHLQKEDIIIAEREYFSFCNFCKEMFYFEYRELGLNWSLEFDCKCDRVKKLMENNMKEKITNHRNEQRELNEKNKLQRLF